MYLAASLATRGNCVFSNMEILAQFLLRLAFGLAFGMAITSPRQVTSGYFRNNLYVTLGLTTLAALVLAPLSKPAAVLAGTAAVFSFIGSACWLYEAKRGGLAAIWMVAAIALLAAWNGMVGNSSGTAPSNIDAPGLAAILSVVTSGLVLGITFAAMLLGHWYLNSPGMELAPLERLISAAAIAVANQSVLSAVGLWMELSAASNEAISWLLFVVMRWSFGLIGVVVLLWMARQTLKIPNTQSATGILYVAVIGVFVGELTALLLSAESAYPL
jgi:hypothetical protein